MLDLAKITLVSTLIIGSLHLSGKPEQELALAPVSTNPVEAEAALRLALENLLQAQEDLEHTQTTWSLAGEVPSGPVSYRVSHSLERSAYLPPCQASPQARALHLQQGEARVLAARAAYEEALQVYRQASGF